MRASPFSIVLGFILASAVAACGAGEGTKTALPPGPHTEAPGGNKILYATLSTGDRVLAYRLGRDGFLPAEPFDEVAIEEPRQVLVHGEIIYVATGDGVASIQLEPDGSMPDKPTAVTRPINNADVSQMIVNEDVLYVSMEGINRIATYPLQAGHVAADAVSSSGAANTNYIPIELVDGVLYAGTRDAARIDPYFVLKDRTLNADPEAQDPEVRIFDVKDLLHHGGILYAIEQDDRRIVTFTILDNGLLPYDPDSQTASQQAYAYLAIADDNLLYASAFNEGRIDLYRLEPGGLFTKKQKVAASTFADTGSFPTQMIIEGGMLYVAQMGIGRIDAYVLGGDGALPQFPSSSTAAIDGVYLNAIALGSGFPP